MAAAIRYLMPPESDYVFLGVHLLAEMDGDYRRKYWLRGTFFKVRKDIK